jgi:branched-chain amino acid transport system ATP-binding protein
MTTRPALEVRDVTVRYGLVTAVDHVSLQVPEDGIVAVLGANGAGKTSLLTALAGVCPGHVEGEVDLFGERSSFRRPHKVVRDGVVLVPEGRRVFAPLTVEENLLVGAVTRRSRAAVRAGVTEMYELFPILGDRRALPAGHLSGGEQQMLALGRALMSQPRLVLLDEPSMGLAPIMVDRVMDAVKEISTRGIAILVVEQNAAAVLRVATEAYVFANGRAVRHGTADDIRSDPVVAKAFLGHDTGADVGGRDVSE